jgi:hypothetical protein
MGHNYKSFIQKQFPNIGLLYRLAKGTTYELPLVLDKESSANPADREASAAAEDQESSCNKKHDPPISSSASAASDSEQEKDQQVELWKIAMSKLENTLTPDEIDSPNKSETQSQPGDIPLTFFYPSSDIGDSSFKDQLPYPSTPPSPHEENVRLHHPKRSKNRTTLKWTPELKGALLMIALEQKETAIANGPADPGLMYTYSMSDLMDAFQKKTGVSVSMSQLHNMLYLVSTF